MPQSESGISRQLCWREPPFFCWLFLSFFVFCLSSRRTDVVKYFSIFVVFSNQQQVTCEVSVWNTKQRINIFPRQVKIHIKITFLEIDTNKTGSNVKMRPWNMESLHYRMNKPFQCIISHGILSYIIASYCLICIFLYHLILYLNNKRDSNRRRSACLEQVCVLIFTLLFSHQEARCCLKLWVLASTGAEWHQDVWKMSQVSQRFYSYCSQVGFSTTSHKCNGKTASERVEKNCSRAFSDGRLLGNRHVT